ncbi:ATP-binding protein [Herbivorax sp. ANBcel31]|uniref:ATP-binding protein n=1 Tax=Herbivorax sp. ANBcel31 TaxID=3069754 RepID=UPI0027ADE51E|nr:ATP-binding protein [Herbivorax sp. ANBcel31]MDQ2086057.1 ATP-binding protein [Herbivorax sp. ANBcel31]
MNKNIYNIIKSEYENRQKETYKLISKKRALVYSKVPLIEEIDRQIQINGIKYNKMILLKSVSSDKALDQLLKKISDLKREKKLLLEKHFNDPDYLERNFYCDKCKDTGFTITSNGTKKCFCFKQQYINNLFSQSNLKLLDRENFSCFNQDYYPDVVDMSKFGIKISPRENILKIKTRAFSFIDNIGSPEEKNLFFSGPTGVGKTFMINCIAKELLERGRTVLYQSSPSLFSIINQHNLKFQRGEILDDTVYNNIYNVELLIIDDLGTESQTAARYAELLNIINIRQENNIIRPCKTIISTNIGINKLNDYYGERVVSRIIGGFDLFKFAGRDIRMLKKFNEDNSKR